MNKKQVVEIRDEFSWKEFVGTVVAGVLIAAVLLAVSGCRSSTVIEEFDAQGKVVKKTTTSESVIKSLVSSTKDKTVVIWRRGWMAGIVASTISEDDPTPVVKIIAGKDDEGALSIHKDQANLDKVADVVRAATVTEGLSVSKDGIGSTGISGSGAALQDTSPVSASTATDSKAE